MVKRQIKGLLLVLVGLGVIGGAFLGPFGTYQELQSHETTEAEILSTGIESAEEVDDGETETEYYPRIEYEYTVDGTSYTDTRVFHPSQVETEPGELEGKEFDERTAAQDIVADYSEGATATVYYDPADVEFSYLRDPASDTLLAVAGMGIFGVVFAGLGLAGILGLVSLDD